MSRRSKETAGTGKERLHPLHKSPTTQVTAFRLMSPGTLALYRKARTLSCVPVCNAQQLFLVRSKATGKPKVRDIWGISVVEDDVETWMSCDAEDCGFNMLNDDEIVTSVQEESDPVDDKTGEDEDNNESSKGS
ncbi:uncharacterized protein TNCV_4785751 [Trichonephila clavipes]|nr:uncharacterized protein TNCV_4785751 [Trichonephila clavipes]